ncbi:baseplate hub [Citrobacter phage IME-CF2]|uniref:Baseplate hub n=2 Tax=Pseudotevenvirus TaxID=2842979 RepID=A0A0K0QSA6_9CAUD|nr:baseplate hub [Escherichia phage RB16]YP_009218635.1 baseplate hub [Citrobacter phage IME-CF2]ADJ55399.1 conserved hypothetical phage protein [Escherichia phage RB16]AKR15943.1 hypothetical protein [Citrobacter phage IME-CF2]
MANNPYYSDEQRRRMQNPKPQPQPTVRKINATLDKASMQELKDINDNTLETALNTLDIKDSVKSFEDRFKEKFAGFQEQYEQDQQPLADQLPDFVGPSRPSVLTDNSTNSVDNSVSVSNQNNPFSKLEAHTSTIADAITKFIELASKKPEPAPEPEPVPEEEPEVDKKKKKIRDKDKDEKKFSKKVLFLLDAIKSNTSSLLSRFIGYSLETIAKFAKWTLIIGSIVFAIEVLGKVIASWFNDLLNDGEASKQLFGSYFNNIKALAKSIDEGLDKLGDKDATLAEKLKALLVEPFKILGNTIKTAITEGIGNLIYALGEYTGSETITNAGRGMKVSALRDKQKYGLEIDPDDLIMLKEQEIQDQKDKITQAREKVVEQVKATQGMFSYGFGQQTEAQQVQSKHLEELRNQVDLEEQITKEKEKELQMLKDNPNLLKEQVLKENTANAKRVDDAKQVEAAQKATKPKAENEFDRGDAILDKDEITGKDKELMEKILESLEEKNNSKKLDEDDSERYRSMLDQWQNKIAVVPESSASIDKQPEPVRAPVEATASNNVQVNNKTVNNTVQHSVQRTERKPLIALA